MLDARIHSSPLACRLMPLPPHDCPTWIRNPEFGVTVAATGVKVGAHKHAVLMLSSVNLPGGQQRMRTYEDQLQMRTFFQEHDLISVSALP